MKIPTAVIITDTHLREENRETVKSIFIQTIEYTLKLGFDTIFHLGDIFHSRKAQTLQVLEMWREILDIIQSFELKLVAICGNHEKTSYEDVASFLHPFQHHPAFTLIDDYFNILLTDNIVCHFLPFFSDEEYQKRLVQISAAYTPTENVADILFTHIGITGARMNNGTQVISISQNSFDLYNKVFLGHYHDKQIFGDGKFNYIGSTLQHNYGETPDKGLTVLYDDLTWETIELDFPRFLNIEIDISKLTPQDIQELKEEKAKSNDNLRVIICGPEEQVKSFNKHIFLESGISVEQKVDRINQSEIEERVEPFTSVTLLEEFDKFTIKQNLTESSSVKGLGYLKQVI